MKKKALSTMEYIFGTFSTLILTIFLLMLFSVLLSNCSHETTEHMIEKQISTLHKESLYLFLISPINSTNPIIPFYETSNFYENNNRIRYNSIPLYLDTQGENFQIKIDDISKIKNINLYIYSGEYSNIALIDGSLDNVLPILEDELIFPDIILWNELSEDHDYVFAGCSSPTNYNRNNLLNWISNGGTLITTDHSIKIIEDLFGKEFVYSGENMIKRDFIDISFKSNSNNIIGSSVRSRIQDSFSSAIKNQSTILAEYENIDDEFCKTTIEGCGYPIHYFNYGEGKVIHFAFHLDSNEEIAKNLFKNINSNIQKPTKLSIHNSTNELIKIDNFGNFETINLIDYIKDCDKECYETFILKGDGKIILRQPKMEIKNSLYASFEYSLIDYIVEAFSTDNQGMIDNIEIMSQNFVNSISVDNSAHRLTFSNLPNRDNLEISSDKFRQNFLTLQSISEEANMEIKLYNNHTIKMHLEKGMTTSGVTRTYLSALWTVIKIQSL